MVRDIAIQLENYLKINTCEGNMVQQFRDYIDHVPGLSPEREHGHITASAWIINFDRTRVLLTHHARLGRWFQLGGHVEDGEDILTAARREAREESGLESLQILNKEIFDIDAHLIPANSKQAEHFHFDIRFLLQADSSEALKISSESHELRWVSPEEAQQLNSSESILRMIEKTNHLEPNVFGEILSGIVYTERQGAYGLLINNKNELALVRVSNPSQLFLPGGGIENGEDHTLCLEREFIEETGLKVSAKGFLGTSVQYIYAHRHPGYYKIVGHMYRCELMKEVGGKVEDDHELEWVPLESARDLMAMDNQRWAVGKLINFIERLDL
jgi:8-oxo-dGTP pyrophosphatase MutT (NUDIX family)